MSLETPVEVVIVSAFGRGHWLAYECRSQGLDVTLIDVSEALGRWAPEDWEGPFGFFHDESVRPSQIQRLEEEDYAEKVEDGFVFWTKTGPVDLRGAHSLYLLNQLEIPEIVQKYVSDYAKMLPKQQQTTLREIQKMPFSRNWFAALSHSVASPFFKPNFEQLQVGKPAALFSPYFVRRVSRKGFEKSLQWLRDKGVRVFEKSQIKDMAQDGRQVLSIEIESERSGVIQGEQFVWGLTSLETKSINAPTFHALFSERAARPSWIWVRYRFEILGTSAEILPIKFWVVDDLAAPWTHEGFMSVQQTTSPSQYDVWLKIPECHRFQKNYLEEVADRAGHLLSEKISEARVRRVEFPQEYHYDENSLGPARHGVYEPEDLARLKPTQYKNIHYDGPETIETLDYLGQWAHQENIFAALMEWRSEKLKRLEKQAEKAREQ